MDELDSKIIQLMMRNARMPVKEIAKQVNLTSPAVSSRIHRMEQEGVRLGEELRLELNVLLKQLLFVALINVML